LEGEQMDADLWVSLICFQRHFHPFSLSSLVTLEARENALSSLPASITFLTKLERLDLGSNEISRLVCSHRW